MEPRDIDWSRADGHRGIILGVVSLFQRRWTGWFRFGTPVGARPAPLIHQAHTP